jgi:hypothetical protein
MPGMESLPPELLRRSAARPNPIDKWTIGDYDVAGHTRLHTPIGGKFLLFY